MDIIDRGPGLWLRKCPESWCNRSCLKEFLRLSKLLIILFAATTVLAQNATFKANNYATNCSTTGVLYSGDFDGDGYQDIGFIDAYGDVGYYQNQQGSGSLGAETVVYSIGQGENLVSLQSTGSGPSSHRLHDFNGDGRDDFMVYRQFCLAALQGGTCTPRVSSLLASPSSDHPRRWLEVAKGENRPHIARPCVS